MRKTTGVHLDRPFDPKTPRRQTTVIRREADVIRDDQRQVGGHGSSKIHRAELQTAILSFQRLQLTQTATVIRKIERLGRISPIPNICRIRVKDTSGKSQIFRRPPGRGVFVLDQWEGNDLSPTGHVDPSSAYQIMVRL